MSALHSLGMLRQAACLSINYLADMVGCEAEYLGRVERMEHTPTLGFISRVADVLADVFKSGVTVTGPGDKTIQPGSIMMEALISADIASRAVTRSRYIITATAQQPAPANAWDRCAGRRIEAENAEGTTWP